VWRAATGLASIAQAAGRCNREGRLHGLGRVVVFEPAEAKIPPMVEAFYGPARDVLRQAEDVLGLDAIAQYYRQVYWRQGTAALDAARLDGHPFPILPAIENTLRPLDFPFSQIAQAFRMIDEVMDPVIVPWDTEAEAAIAVLRAAPFPPAGIRRKLQHYTVPVPKQARAAMYASGAVQAVRLEDYGDRFMVLESRSLYDDDLGLRLDDPTWRSAESNIIS